MWDVDLRPSTAMGEKELSKKVYKLDDELRNIKDKYNRLKSKYYRLSQKNTQEDAYFRAFKTIRDSRELTELEMVKQMNLVLKKRISLLEQVAKQNSDEIMSHNKARMCELAKIFGVDYYKCFVDSRKRQQYVLCRAAYVHLRILEGANKSEIGRELGKDHSSIIHLINNVIHKIPTFYIDFINENMISYD